MRRRPRRVVPAVVVALTLLAGCVIVALSLIQRLTGASEFISYDGVMNRLHETTWGDPRGAGVGVAALAAGVMLVALAVLPGRSIVVPLVADDEVTAGVGRRGLHEALRAAAQSVDGVRSARVRLRRKRIRITARHDGGVELAHSVRAAVEERLSRIGPCATSRLPAALRQMPADGAPHNRPARLNRTLLGVIGVLCLALGGYLLAAHYALLGWVDTSAPLIAEVSPPPAWMQWTIVAVAAAVGLACVYWVSLQVRRIPAGSRWRARVPGAEDVITLDSTTAAMPVMADIETYAGVHSASAWLLGPGVAPELHLVVTTTPDADVAALRHRILTHAVPRLRQALEVDAVPVTMEVHLTEAQSSAPSTRSTYGFAKRPLGSKRRRTSWKRSQCG
ncbi:DUF6286 domain-containing protein [Nocardia transvalensis]|uniref:DUF6286 domain-containing protein n=1 Tax=Nocardia transvalensis TaxID=37333 RepID=UPI001895BA95|nr:DUF6286 domain-containing protein [Nocardia transvalensis]MBF6326907.1 hypothetical protein [Nocardia transvalensis]